MKYKRHFLLLTLAGGLLLAAIGVQVYAKNKYPHTNSLKNQKLEQIIPLSVQGWTSKDLPIAQSDAAIGNVEKILRYDDVLFRRYTRGTMTVDIYVAYWRSGKMSYWDVGSHNPDSCWIYNGFTCSERVYGKRIEDSELPLKPFEFGRYSHSGQNIDAMFWHLVGGEPNRYQEQREGWRNGITGRIERLPLVIKDIRTYGLDMRREQFFIRISSNQPLDGLLENYHFRSLLGSLSPLGIFERETVGDAAIVGI